MSHKPKFKPVITRIKLNPEQAVLTCSCYSAGNAFAAEANKGSVSGSIFYCNPGVRSGGDVICVGSLRGSIVGRTSTDGSGANS